MRMSCNGCRVLRKGCTDDCTIRPCLQWITSPESQANATVFLAKFYGRAGLLNLINAGAEHLRPAIFRSLLYEACGRIMNPVYGSVGLLWSGNWPLCQNAVEAVLRGEPITQLVTPDPAEANNGPPLQAYDIRHVPKDDSNDLHRVRNRSKFKRTAAGKELNVSVSHDSGLSHQSEAVINGEGDSQGTTDHTLLTAEGSALFRAETEPVWLAPKDYNNGGAGGGESEELELELTLGVKRGKSI